MRVFLLKYGQKLMKGYKIYVSKALLINSPLYSYVQKLSQNI